MTLLAALLLPACLGFPILRTGPSQAWIKGVPEDARHLVKGRLPYLVTPAISRSAKRRLGYGPVVTVESRDHVHMVRVHNDSALEVWIRTFGEAGIPVRAVICREGKPFPLAIPHALQPGAQRTILVPDQGRTRHIRMRLGTYVDKDDLDLEFGPGPELVAGFAIIPFSRYHYTPLPAACLAAARALGR